MEHGFLAVISRPENRRPRGSPDGRQCRVDRRSICSCEIFAVRKFFVRNLLDFNRKSHATRFCLTTDDFLRRKFISYTKIVYRKVSFVAKIVLLRMRKKKSRENRIPRGPKSRFSSAFGRSRILGAILKINLIKLINYLKMVRLIRSFVQFVCNFRALRAKVVKTPDQSDHFRVLINLIKLIP